VLVATMAPPVLARSAASLDGTWGGTVAVGPRRPPGTASSALAQSGRGVKGSLTIDDGTASGVFSVSGTLRGKHALLIGKHGARRLRWEARYDPKTQSWRGPMVQRTGAARLHGRLVLVRSQARGPICGADYFAGVVMPRVIDPICSLCHVPGGLAQAAPFKVTPGNPAATAASAVHEVNPADPPLADETASASWGPTFAAAGPSPSRSRPDRAPTCRRSPA